MKPSNNEFNREELQFFRLILYEDESILVIEKPEGLIVHPKNAKDVSISVASLFKEYMGDKILPGEDFRKGIVHRLDVGTHGLLVLAKTDQALNFLINEFKEHRVDRHYLALVYGNVESDAGVIDKPLGRNRRNRLKMTVDLKGKNALTKYEVVHRYGKYTLVRARLETGRMHQIRVHFAYINHPIVADFLYAKGRKNFGSHYPLLSCNRIQLKHPISSKDLKFTVSLPEHFEKVIQMLEHN